MNRFAWLALIAASLGVIVASSCGAAETAATAPAAQPQPAASAVSETATEEAPSSYPPGLIMEGMKALGAKQGMDDLGLRIWGFVESGFTGRLTGGQHPLPGRVFDARRPNNLRLNQLRLTLDRPYDNTKAFDLGGRIDGLFGGDALLTHSPGLFDKAGEGQGDDWADLLQAYAQGWFKTGKESGLEITFGKFVTPIGFEVIDAIGNPLYSHSYLFGYAIPFTHTGVMTKYYFNSQWSAYFAIVEGWEVFEDNNHAHSYMAGGAWTSSQQVDGKACDAVYLNVITGPEQQGIVHNYRTVVDGIYTHNWTGKLSQSINADYGTEENGVTTEAEDGTISTERARWYGAAHYLTYVFNDYVSGTWRAEWFRDDGGARTGVDASWYESTWGLTLTPFPNDKVLKYLSFRPEFRWDWADRAAFGDDHRNQLTAAFDVIFKF